ncbi:MAG: hypothetical protein RJQ08_11480 [Salinisphaeraceae bacterium]
MRRNTLWILVGLGLLSTTAVAQPKQTDRYPDETFGATPRLDQRRPDYQASYEHLARARSLLREAARQARMSEQNYALPGFRYDLFREDVRYLDQQLGPILMPEQRRLRYQKIVPDSAYLTPEASEITVSPSRNAPSK